MAFYFFNLQTCKNLVTSVSILLHLVAIAFYFFNLWVNATFFRNSLRNPVWFYGFLSTQFPLKRNRPENSIFIAFDKVSSEVLLSLSPGCPESLLGDNNNNKKVTFRFNITNTYNSCTNLSQLWCQVMQRCVLEYPKVMICQCSSFRFSFKSLVDLALLARKKEASIKQTLQGRIQDFF